MFNYRTTNFHVLPVILLFAAVYINIPINIFSKDIPANISYIIFIGQLVMSLIVYYMIYYLVLAFNDSINKYFNKNSLETKMKKIIWPYFVFIARIWMITGLESVYILLLYFKNGDDITNNKHYILVLFVFILTIHVFIEYVIFRSNYHNPSRTKTRSE